MTKACHQLGIRSGRSLGSSVRVFVGVFSFATGNAGATQGGGSPFNPDSEGLLDLTDNRP